MTRTMDCDTAGASGVVERYLLGECTPEEQEAFEAHYFDCRSCAEEIRMGSIFIDNARAVMREQPRGVAEKRESSFRKPAANRSRRQWFEWLRPAVLVPAFAAVLMAIVAGYETFAIIPALRQPQVLSAIVLAPQARDSGPVVPVDRGRAMFNLNFSVDSPRVFPNYRCVFQKDAGGAPVLSLETGPRDVSAFTLSVLLPSSKFPDGTYTMSVSPLSEPSSPIHRYTFTVRSGGSD